jgi:predicted AlkP superfamily phosphohydrolase/phosphomutase
MNTHRLLIIGLDGGNLEVIDPLIAQGRLPNLARIRLQGSSGVLRSVIPPHSAPAWITFMTGWNSGRHGVFDFWERDWSAYNSPVEGLVTTDRFAGRTFWDYASANGIRTGVVTVPVTYPAWPVNGFMLSGYLLSPGMNEDSAYPSDLADRFERQLLFPEAYRKGASHEAVMREGPRMICMRGQVAAQLQDEYKSELLVVVLAPTDKAQHDFWRYREPDCPPDLKARYGDVINQHYEACDAVIGDLWDQMGEEETNVIVISDHGGGPYPRRCLHTNYALRQNGLLTPKEPRRGRRKGTDRMTWLRTLRFKLRGDIYHRLKTWGKQLLPDRAWRALQNRYQGTAAIDWEQTLCYRVELQTPAEGIIINLKGRQPKGIVEPGQEYESIRKQVAEAMTQLTDPETGQPIVEECYMREDIFSGPCVEKMPDIFLVLRQGYKSDNRLDAGLVGPTPQSELERFRGAHTMNGILMAAGPDIRGGATLRGANLIDTTPTFMYLAAMPIPEDMDGHVLTEVIREECLQTRPVHTTTDVLSGQPQERAFTADEEQEIVDRLAGLGYLE